MDKKIPVYSQSYSPEENKRMHEYLESASDKELVQWIFKLADLYPDQERQQLIQVLTNFSKEVVQRCQMDERYDKLEKCVSEWTKYHSALLAKKIQEAYKNYKKLAEHNKGLKSSVDGFLGYAAKRKDPLFLRCTTWTIQQSLSAKMYQEIENVSEPVKKYKTLEEIPVKKYTIGEGLEQLGSKNLKYILSMLLWYVDSPDEKSTPAAALMLLTRKYSAFRSHKKGNLKNQAWFATPTYTYTELLNKCNDLLAQLKIM